MNGSFIKKTVYRVLRQGGAFALLLCLCFSAIACGKLGNAPKSFSAAELTITLTEQFKEMKSTQYTAAYDSGEVAVMIVKEKFTALGKLSGCTLEEYAQLVLETNRPDESMTLQKQNGLTYFEHEYVQGEDKEHYTNLIVIYQSAKAFWLVQFATRTEQMAEYRPQFFEWAKSVSFAE